MYIEPVYLPSSDPMVSRILRAIGSKKRKASVRASESVAYTGTYWDGGSRSEYTAVRLSDGKAVHGPQFNPPQFNPPQFNPPQFNPPQFGGPRVDPVVAVPPGIVIVEHGTFCGKEATPRIHVNPADLPVCFPAAVPVPTLPAGS